MKHIQVDLNKLECHGQVVLPLDNPYSEFYRKKLLICCLLIVSELFVSELFVKFRYWIGLRDLEYCHADKNKSLMCDPGPQNQS